MKRTVQYSRGQVRYTGKLDHAAFTAWCQSPDGWPVLKPLIAETRFSLFGRKRAAQRGLWQQLKQTARSTSMVGALQHHVDAHFARLSRIVYARDLPMVGVSLHRLIAVPRLFANSVTDRQMDSALQKEPVFASVNRREPLRHWFIFALINGIEAATLAAKPSPKKPIPAGSDWIVVGVNNTFEWRLPLQGPAWPGHYYLLELTHTPITRAVRKEVAKAIAQMEASLPGLSRVDRNEILRQAGVSLEKLAAKAG
jgi:hypothetical protein